MNGPVCWDRCAFAVKAIRLAGWRVVLRSLLPPDAGHRAVEYSAPQSFCYVVYASMAEGCCLAFSDCNIEIIHHFSAQNA